MRRGIGLRRQTPLVRKTPLRSQRRPRRRYKGVPTAIRDKVLRRDGCRCRRCGRYGARRRLEVHHLLLRSRGGRDRAENLITLCPRCHEWAHAAEAHLQELLLCDTSPGWRWPDDEGGLPATAAQ